MNLHDAGWVEDEIAFDYLEDFLQILGSKLKTCHRLREESHKIDFRTRQRILIFHLCRRIFDSFFPQVKGVFKQVDKFFLASGICPERNKLYDERMIFNASFSKGLCYSRPLIDLPLSKSSRHLIPRP